MGVCSPSMTIPIGKLKLIFRLLACVKLHAKHTLKIFGARLVQKHTMCNHQQGMCV